jgi:ribosomal protein S12 methylthiotransferase
VKPVPVVALVHLGCARNLIDSELILARLVDEGLRVSSDASLADTVVLNTCSFIGPAREESESKLRELLQRKRRKQLQRVVVAGCLVQRYKRTLERRFPQVDLFAEISDGRELAQSIRRMAAGERVPKYLENRGLREASRDRARLLATPRSYAYLRISHGCDHQCSFCAIPAIRGPHRSKRPEDLIDEARELIDAGVRELVLVAEDSTAWGREMGLELPDLVQSLADLKGAHRVRVMYAYPNRFPWRLAELLRDHPRVLPYLDLPVQHVATGVLRAMRRAGSGDQVRAILDRLRSEVPNLTLRTTLLLGFPGETRADVAELVEFVQRYELGRLGAFTYSPEEGTAGWDLPDRVPPEEQERRLCEVLAVRDAVLARSQGSRVGTDIDVTVDSVEPGRDAALVARADWDAPEVDLVARVRGVTAGVGERVQVRVAEVDADLDLVCGPAPGHRVADPNTRSADRS